MISKNCVVCATPFSVPDISRGTDKVYCSSSCRSKAGNERMFKKLVNQSIKPIENEIKEPVVKPTNTPTYQETAYYEPKGFNPSSSSIGYLERSYEAKIEALEYKLRFENSERDNIALRKELEELEAEFDLLPIPESKSEKMIMGLMEGFVPILPSVLEKLMSGDKKVV